MHTKALFKASKFKNLMINMTFIHYNEQSTDMKQYVRKVCAYTKQLQQNCIDLTQFKKNLQGYIAPSFSTGQLKSYVNQTLPYVTVYLTAHEKQAIEMCTDRCR